MQRFDYTPEFSLQTQIDVVSRLIDQSSENHDALIAWYCRLLEQDWKQKGQAAESPAIREL